MKQFLAELAIRAALKLWRTDLDFSDYPYGPPDHGFRYGLASRLFEWGRAALDNGRAE